MAEFALLIRTYDGIVAIADKEKSHNQSTGIIKINKNTVGIVFKGLDGAKKFYNELTSKITDSDDFAKICTTAVDEFNLHQKEYREADLSIILISHMKPRRTIFYGFWFDDDGAHTGNISGAHAFSKIHENLLQYLINKVYSNHMLVDELSNLSSFATLQCVKIFPIGLEFDYVTLSDKEVKWLTDGEIKDQFYKQEKVDHKLLKLFSDFFLDEVRSK